MARIITLVLLSVATVTSAQVAPPRALTGPQPSVVVVPTEVSFNKDVLPILQKNCQACHRSGEAAPMSFLTYESTRPWAKAIKQAVATKKMPPWFADPGYGEFRNDPSLTAQEIAILAAWADHGAPEGNAQDKPKDIAWPSGWRIEPDVVLSIPQAHSVPAKGNGEIKAFLVDNPFAQDTWVSAIEVRPGNPSVVHHVMLQVPEDTPDAPPFSWGGVSTPTCAVSTPLAQQQDFNEALPFPIANRLNGTRSSPSSNPPKNFAILEAVYAPGSPPMDFSLYNSAKLIQGGGKLRIEVHYTPNGTATSDQTRIGFKVAKQPPQYRYVTLAPKNLADANRRIPAGEPNWETRGELEFGRNAELVWLMPHMHLRGKDMTFSLVAPSGRAETVLDAKFNFNWQLGYEMQQPIRVRKGTRMVVVAHHDNSANNRYNPDPTKEVGWGDLTSDEMVLPWFGVIVDRDANPENILSLRQGGCNRLVDAIPSLFRVPGLNGTPALTTPTLPIPILPVRVDGKD